MKVCASVFVGPMTIILNIMFVFCEVYVLKRRPPPCQENTHDDIMKCVMARLKQMCSCEHLFDWSADGFCFMFSSVQGDLKWIFDRYGLHNFHANACCSLCGAVKNHANLSMTIADFRPTAAHINSEPDLSGFLARNSSVFQLATRDRVLHDVMHGQLLGTGKVLNGSVLVYMCESGVFGDFQPGGAGIYEQCLESVLRAAHCDFLRFKKEGVSKLCNLALHLQGAQGRLECNTRCFLARQQHQRP